jgi:hypothetical protein
MDPYVFVVTAVLNSITYYHDAYDAPALPEADFVPFDLSYLRDFSGRSEEVRKPFEGFRQNASDALPV